MKIQENKRYLILIYMLGFLCGILYLNIVSGKYIMDTGVWGEPFREQYLQTEINMGEFFGYVVYVRVCPIICLAILGCTKLRKTAVYGFLLWTGFSSGMILTSAVIKMGIKGIILCLISLTPHFICYTAGYVIFLWFLLNYPAVRWNLSRTVCFTLLMAMGILLECYVNPVVMKLFLASLT